MMENARLEDASTALDAALKRAKRKYRDLPSLVERSRDQMSGPFMAPADRLVLQAYSEYLSAGSDLMGSVASADDIERTGLAQVISLASRRARSPAGAGIL
jgi:hypothetical protein